eukprot:750130-Hanusia_phi.AAC.7
MKKLSFLLRHLITLEVASSGQGRNRGEELKDRYQQHKIRSKQEVENYSNVVSVHKKRKFLVAPRFLSSVHLAETKCDLRGGRAVTEMAKERPDERFDGDKDKEKQGKKSSRNVSRGEEEKARQEEHKEKRKVRGARHINARADLPRLVDANFPHTS